MTVRFKIRLQRGGPVLFSLTGIALRCCAEDSRADGLELLRMVRGRQRAEEMKRQRTIVRCVKSSVLYEDDAEGCRPRSSMLGRRQFSEVTLERAVRASDC